MPNHVRNVWRIKNIPPEKINYVLDKLSMVYERHHDDGAPEVKERIIDFDLIIPEPRFKQDCPKKYQVNKHSHVEEVAGREWFDWYEWHSDMWGTKWNAYDGYTKVGKTQITFVFNTAWSFPHPIASQLIKLGYDLDLKFADENIGSNCGKMQYNVAEESWSMQVEDDLPNPESFAKYIWNNY